MGILKSELVRILPYCRPYADRYMPFINPAMEEYQIINRTRIAAFLANVGHESGQLARAEESLTYSVGRLMAVWPKRFPTAAKAVEYAHQPEKLANYVYANRMGNKGPESGDGWRHRGAGLLQATGYDMHFEIGQHFEIATHVVGDWLRSPEGACRSAAYIFWRKGCNALADKGDFDSICDRINIGHDTEREGDAIGYAERAALYNIALKVLA